MTSQPTGSPPPRIRPALAALFPLLVSLALAGGMALATQNAGPQLQLVAAAVTFLVCCWGFRLASEGVAALFFFLVLGVSRAVEPPQIFAGFTTAAFWLIFSGLILGRAVQDSGLGARLALLLRPNGTTTYNAMLLRLLVLGAVFAFCVPSAMGRVLLMLPLLRTAALECGFTEGRKGYTGFMLAGVLGTYLPAFAILPANMPNVVFSGAVAALYGINIGYMNYLLLLFPVLGLLKLAVTLPLLCTLFPDTLPPQAPAREPAPWSPRERLTAIVLFAALAAWMLDSWHGISPGWVSLAAAVILLLPVPGWFGSSLFKGVGLDPLLFAACAISVGSIIQSSGLGDFFAATLLELLPLDQGPTLGIKGLLLGVFTGTGLLTSLPGIPSALAPIADDIARSSGMSLVEVLTLQALAYTTVLLPYQAPPLIMATAGGGVPYRAMAAMCLLLAAISLLLLIPLQMLWGALLGLSLV
ncbi:SLC13 family permease [Megalodesulfovibrio paquesii]